MARTEIRFFSSFAERFFFLTVPLDLFYLKKQPRDHRAHGAPQSSEQCALHHRLTSGLQQILSKGVLLRFHFNALLSIKRERTTQRAATTTITTMFRLSSIQ